eukprot:4437324-Prymnesium_polylepis.1
MLIRSEIVDDYDFWPPPRVSFICTTIEFISLHGCPKVPTSPFPTGSPLPGVWIEHTFCPLAVRREETQPWWSPRRNTQVSSGTQRCTITAKSLQAELTEPECLAAPDGRFVFCSVVHWASL